MRIGANRIDSASGGTFQHVNPATGRIDADVPLAGVEEVDQAVRTADEAFQTWRRTKPADRRRMLLRLADLIEEHSADFCRLAAFDNGTPRCRRTTRR